MKVDKFGQQIFSEMDLCNILLQNPHMVLNHVIVDKDIHFDSDLELENVPSVKLYQPSQSTLQQFDADNQQKWYMPQSYMDLDIAKWVLLACNGDRPQIQRCADELIRYQEFDLMSLLKYLKYLVDTMRLNNIVWGVGRGSSVSSYVLYKIGVHKIDSMYYDLDFTEFLRKE